MRAPAAAEARRWWRSAWLLIAGAAALTVPTFYLLARDYWSDQSGGHGPIVLATGIWLLLGERHRVSPVAAPGHPALAYFVFAGCLCGYVFARMTGMLGIECAAAYGALLAVFYYHAGWRAIRVLAFPLIYFIFMFPLPETLILPLSQMLKLALSSAAVQLLSAFGYAVGHGGVVIYIDQYELLMADACSGLNSLIGLSVISTFYAYVRHEGNWRSALPLLLAIAPIAVFSNFIRVLVLILVTHHFGDRVAQVYVHDIAGIMLFTVAVGMMMALDWLVERIRARRRKHA